MDTLDALVDMIGCQSVEWVVAAVDSAIAARLIGREDWMRATADRPARLRSLLREADGVPGSGIESILRFRLRRLGYLPRAQVRIPGAGRVDFVLGRDLVIEVDGWEYHRHRAAFERDRARDAELLRRGYRVLRITFRRILDDWPELRQTIADCVSRSRP